MAGAGVPRPYTSMIFTGQKDDYVRVGHNFQARATQRVAPTGP